MTIKDQILTCQWCGASGPAEEFELDEQHGDGFWCPDCDGHTFYDQEKNQQRRMLLLLETSTGKEDPVMPSGLKKRMSPLRYPGGKSKFIDYLAAEFKDEQMNTFVEAFAGGASVGLALLEGERTKHLVINDTDPGVYAFWKIVCEQPESLLEKLDRRPPVMGDLYSAKGMLSSPSNWSTEALAWAELVANRLSYSGIIKANPLGGKHGTEKDLLVRWNPAELKKRIQRIHGMADRITVSKVDAMALIENSAYWDQKSTLFIDPPYVTVGKALYQRYFTDDDHRQLAWMLQTLYTGMPGADLVITYNDCELIRELYPYAEQRRVGRFFSCKIQHKLVG